MTALKTLFVVAVAASLFGCAATGVQVTEAQTSGFVKGETTRSEVLQTLGSPTMQSTMPDGTRMVMYTYAEATVRPSTFIPIVGAFVGGTDSRGSSVVLRFDSEDKLIDTSSSESSYGTAHGISSGVNAPPQQQPRK